MGERTTKKYLNLGILAFAMAQGGYRWWRDARGADTPGGKQIKPVEIPALGQYLAEGLFGAMGMPLKVDIKAPDDQKDIVISVFGVLFWMGTFIMSVRDWAEKSTEPGSDGGANISTKEIDELAMITAISLKDGFDMDLDVSIVLNE